MNLEQLLEKAKNKDQKELNLSNMSLSEIPKEVFQLKHIETLKVMNNNLTELPKEIIGMSKLRNLYLYKNKIRAIPENILLEMPYLNCFDLADNPLDNNSIVDFHYKFNKRKGYQEFLDDLEWFKKGDKKYFFHFGSLRIFPIEIFDFIELEHLALNGIKINKIPEGIGKLKNLRSLDLSDNNLEEIPQDLFQLANLEELSLNSNNFQRFPDEILDLPKIRKIYICNNKLNTFNRKVFDHPTIETFVALENPFVDFDSNLFNYDFKTLKKRYK